MPESPRLRSLPHAFPSDGCPARPQIENALSVDVEEYYHALIFREGTKGRSGGALASRVEDSVERVLIAAGGVTPQLEQSGYFHQILDLDAIVDGPSSRVSEE